MIKFLLTTRPKTGGEPGMFDYEWGVIHPALMVTTESVVRAFHRYAQHRYVDGATPQDLRIPPAPEGWSTMADHWLENFDALNEVFTPEYMRRMHPHNFGDPQFVIELAEGHVIKDDPGRRDGVKVVSFVKSIPGLDFDEFVSTWTGDVARRTLAADSAAIIKKYVLNTRLPIDPALFTGTLFELGGCGQYAGIEEIWFDSVEDARRFASDEYADAHAALREVVDVDASFSMLLIERVVWDRTVDGPEPSIFNPDSFESRVVATERQADQWHTPLPARTLTPAAL